MLRTRTVIWPRRLAMRRGPPTLCAPARRLDVPQGCGLRAKRRRWAWHSLILKRRLSERPFEHPWQSCAYLQAGAQANSKFSGLRAPANSITDSRGAVPAIGGRQHLPETDSDPRSRFLRICPALQRVDPRASGGWSRRRHGGCPTPPPSAPRPAARSAGRHRS
jgi:hypothetical protein